MAEIPSYMIIYAISNSPNNVLLNTKNVLNQSKISSTPFILFFFLKIILPILGTVILICCILIAVWCKKHKPHRRLANRCEEMARIYKGKNCFFFVFF
jgi:hypothetical protein